MLSNFGKILHSNFLKTTSFQFCRQKINHIPLKFFTEQLRPKTIEKEQEKSKIDYKTAVEEKDATGFQKSQNRQKRDLEKENRERMNETGQNEEQPDQNEINFSSQNLSHDNQIHQEELQQQESKKQQTERKEEKSQNDEAKKEDKNKKASRKSLDDLKHYGGKEILEVKSFSDIWGRLMDTIVGEREPDFKKLHDEYYKEARISSDVLDKQAKKFKEFVMNQRRIMEDQMNKELKGLDIPIEEWNKAIERQKKIDKDFRDLADSYEIVITDWIYPEEVVEQEKIQEIKKFFDSKMEQYQKHQASLEKSEKKDEISLKDESPKFIKDKIVNDIVEKFKVNPRTAYYIIDNKRLTSDYRGRKDFYKNYF